MHEESDWSLCTPMFTRSPGDVQSLACTSSRRSGVLSLSQGCFLVNLFRGLVLWLSRHGSELVRGLHPIYLAP